MSRNVPVDFQMFKTWSMKKFPGYHVTRDISFLPVVCATIDVCIPGSKVPRRMEMGLHAPEIDELGKPSGVPGSSVTEVLDGEKVDMEGLHVPEATKTSPIQEQFNAVLFPEDDVPVDLGDDDTGEEFATPYQRPDGILLGRCHWESTGRIFPATSFLSKSQIQALVNDLHHEFDRETEVCLTYVLWHRHSWRG